VLLERLRSFLAGRSARRLAAQGRRQQRERVKATTRQMREDMGLPPLEALR
jgi:hypothetical protein